MYAYAHDTLDDETIKFTGFSSSDRLFAFNRGFNGLEGLPSFFAQQMSLLFKNLVRQGSALVYAATYQTTSWYC